MTQLGYLHLLKDGGPATMKRHLLLITPCLVLLIGSVWVLGSMAEAAMIGNTLPNGIYMQRNVKSLEQEEGILLFQILMNIKGSK